jgi:hypothetical protein
VIRTDGWPPNWSRWPAIVYDASLVLHASHRIDPVHYQVQQYLLELDAVAGYARQVFGQSCSHFDAVLGQLLGRQQRWFFCARVQLLKQRGNWRPSQSSSRW